MLLNKIKTLCSETKKMRTRLLGAKMFNNQDEINRIVYRLTHNNAMIADHVMDLLERIEKADPKGTISASVNANIEIADDSSVNVYSIDRNRGK